MPSARLARRTPISSRGKRGARSARSTVAFGWAEGLPMMKWMTDHMLVNGINRFVPHAFFPEISGCRLPAALLCAGRHPQFPLFGRLMQYTQRMCHLLTGGEPMLSAAVLYNAEAEWCGGDKMLFQKVLKALTRRQLNADVVPADMLETAAVENGRLVINRIPFSTLIVPYSEILPQALLESLAAVAKAGCRWCLRTGCAARPRRGATPGTLIRRLRWCRWTGSQTGYRCTAGQISPRSGPAHICGFIICAAEKTMFSCFSTSRVRRSIRC